MIIELDIQNCSDKKGLVYALAECGYPVAIKQTARSRIIPTAQILIVNLEKSEEDVLNESANS